LETWVNLTRNFLNKNREPVLKSIKFGKSPPLKDLTWTNQTFCQNSKLDFEDSNQIWTKLNFEKYPKVFPQGHTNGLRYPRWGGRRDAVRLEKGWGVEKGLESRQNPQRRVHALLGVCGLSKTCRPKKQNPAFHWLDFTRDPIFYKPDFAIETETKLEKRQRLGLAETFAENWLC